MVDPLLELKLLEALTRVLSEVGEVPSGTVYSALIGKVTLADYQAVLSLMERIGVIKVDSNHMIRWTGPKLESPHAA